MRLSGCDRPVHGDISACHIGHRGNHIDYFQGNYDVFLRFTEMSQFSDDYWRHGTHYAL